MVLHFFPVFKVVTSPIADRENTQWPTSELARSVDPQCQSVRRRASARAACCWPRWATAPGAIFPKDKPETAFHATRGASVLDTIGATIGGVPRILLRDTAVGEEPSPIIRPTNRNETSIRYRIDGEIACGGMGSVLKGRDPDLGRDVAIKVLREDLRENGDLVRRFVEEAPDRRPVAASRRGADLRAGDIHR